MTTAAIRGRRLPGWAPVTRVPNAEAERAFQEAAELAPGEVLAPYHLAALSAGWARPDDALALLARAAEMDKERVKEWSESDRMFDPLRADPRFSAIFGD